MDFLAQRRLAAHTRSANHLERDAEFHDALAEFFQSLGEDLYATGARQHANDQRRAALRERIHALAADGVAHPATLRGHLRLTAYSDRQFLSRG